MTCSARTSIWIVSPRVDLFFICGGAMVLLTALHSIARLTSSTHQLQYFADLSVLLALLLSETHTVSTIFAVDSRKAEESQFNHHQFKYFLRAAGAASLALIILVCTFAWLAPYVVRLYLLTVSWHFISQARGIIFIYLKRANCRLTSFQFFVCNWLLRLSIINWMLVQLSSYFGDAPETFLYQKLAVIQVVPKSCVDVLIAAIAVLLIAAAVNLVARKLRRQPLPPLPAILLLSFAVLLFLPCNPIASLQPSIWLFAPALFHGSQYLCVVAAKLRKAAAIEDDSAKLTFLLRRYGQCLLFSVGVFLLLPWLLTALSQSLCHLQEHSQGHFQGLTYAVAVAAIFVGVQTYHMAIDSVIWRHKSGI